jgi:hypothetical protein
MNPRWRGLTVLCLFFGIVSVYGQTPQAPSPAQADRDAFVGTWKANRLMSRPKLSKRDALYTRTIGREGDERVFRSITEGEKASARSFRIRCDGQMHYVSELTNRMECAYVAPNLVEGATDLNGQIAYWTEQLSPDGQQMTVTSYKDKKRTKIKMTLVLDRIK